MATFTITELESMIVVNMGDYKTSKGEKKLMTKDLGSCVGVAVRDPQTGVGGLLHVMLPHHGEAGDGMPFVAAKYADTGLDEMVRALVMQGAVRERLVAKIAGAAHMIRNATIPESRDISSRNLEAVTKSSRSFRYRCSPLRWESISHGQSCLSREAAHSGFTRRADKKGRYEKANMKR